MSLNPFAALVSLLISAYIYIILTRFFLQYFRADFYNPVSQFVVKATDLFVKPVRKIIPGFGGIDLSTMVLAWLFVIAKLFLIKLLSGQVATINPLLLLIASPIGLLQSIIGLYMFLIIVRAISTWINTGGYNPALAVVGQLTEPLISKARKILPPMSGLDLSPMLVLIMLWLIDYSISYYL